MWLFAFCVGVVAVRTQQDTSTAISHADDIMNRS
jgi:hypothetical protein